MQGLWFWVQGWGFELVLWKLFRNEGQVLWVGFSVKSRGLTWIQPHEAFPAFP